MIENLKDKDMSHQFLSVVKDLEPPGSLSDNISYDFSFSRVEKLYESFHNGTALRVSYFILVVLNRTYGKITKEEDFLVYRVVSGDSSELMVADPGIKMDVGIDECLQYECTLERSRFHLKDVILGSIVFKVLKLKIVHIEVSILRKEIIVSGGTTVSESEILNRFEIMDGGPIKGERIPIRIYLASTDLTPSYKNQRFQVKYFLNMILHDDCDRKYFKQQEVEIWRKKI